MILSELSPLGPCVSQINRFRWSLKGVGTGGWGGQLKHFHDINTCMVSVMHSGDIHSFIYAISFYIGLIMLISMSAPRMAVCHFLMDLQLLGLF